jgi:hypothetical protein
MFKMIGIVNVPEEPRCVANQSQDCRRLLNNCAGTQFFCLCKPDQGS